ncbi:hypothetical protein BGX21_001888 [Mortierella sp. AD011]|nr:hypothetical protein BGX21_001888 [Mortierella sp. AD011]
MLQGPVVKESQLTYHKIRQGLLPIGQSEYETIRKNKAKKPSMDEARGMISEEQLDLNKLIHFYLTLRVHNTYNLANNAVPVQAANQGVGRALDQAPDQDAFQDAYQDADQDASQVNLQDATREAIRKDIINAVEPGLRLQLEAHREQKRREAFEECQKELEESWLRLGKVIMRDEKTRSAKRKCTLTYMQSTVEVLKRATLEVAGIDKVGAGRTCQ